MTDPAFVALRQSIAANVRRARQRKGLTQEQLADKAEQDVSYLQRVERGAVNLSLRVLFHLARALEVTPASLLRRAKLAAVRRGRPKKDRI